MLLVKGGCRLPTAVGRGAVSPPASPALECGKLPGADSASANDRRRSFASSATLDEFQTVMNIRVVRQRALSLFSATQYVACWP
jgi:hypothetical protein